MLKLLGGNWRGLLNFLGCGTGLFFFMLLEFDSSMEDSLDSETFNLGLAFGILGGGGGGGGSLLGKPGFSLISGFCGLFKVEHANKLM